MIIHASSNSAHVSLPESATKSLDGFRAWVYSDSFPEEGKYTYFRTEVLLDMAAERANSGVGSCQRQQRRQRYAVVDDCLSRGWHSRILAGRRAGRGD